MNQETKDNLLLAITTIESLLQDAMKIAQTTREILNEE